MTKVDCKRPHLNEGKNMIFCLSSKSLDNNHFDLLRRDNGLSNKLHGYIYTISFFFLTVRVGSKS